MMLEPNQRQRVDYRADQMNVDKEDHVLTLEGHVRIVVHRTPSEQVTTDPRSVIIEGDKVVITPQPAGGAKVEIENGSIREL